MPQINFVPRILFLVPLPNDRFYPRDFYVVIFYPSLLILLRPKTLPCFELIINNVVKTFLNNNNNNHNNNLKNAIFEN